MKKLFLSQIRDVIAPMELMQACQLWCRNQTDTKTCKSFDFEVTRDQHYYELEKKMRFYIFSTYLFVHDFFWW